MSSSPSINKPDIHRSSHSSNQGKKIGNQASSPEENQRHLGGIRSHIDLICKACKQYAQPQPDPRNPIHKPQPCCKSTSLISPWRAVVEPAGPTLDSLLLCDGNDIDGDRIETQALEQILRLAVDIQLSALRRLCEIES